MDRVQELMMKRFADPKMAEIVMSSAELMGIALRLASLPEEAQQRLAAAPGIVDALDNATVDQETFTTFAQDPEALRKLGLALEAIEAGETPSPDLLRGPPFESIALKPPPPPPPPQEEDDASEDDDDYISDDDANAEDTNDDANVDDADDADDDMYDSTRTVRSGLALLGATMRARCVLRLSRAWSRWITCPRETVRAAITASDKDGLVVVFLTLPAFASALYEACSPGVDLVSESGEVLEPTARLRGGVLALVQRRRKKQATEIAAEDALCLFAVWDVVSSAARTDLETAWRRWTVPAPLSAVAQLALQVNEIESELRRYALRLRPRWIGRAVGVLHTAQRRRFFGRWTRAVLRHRKLFEKEQAPPAAPYEEDPVLAATRPRDQQQPRDQPRLRQPTHLSSTSPPQRRRRRSESCSAARSRRSGPTSPLLSRATPLLQTPNLWPPPSYQ